MAYNSSKYQLTKLLQEAWYRLGQLKTWTATGGSATTLVNSKWEGIDDAIFEDDDAGLIYGTAVVIKTTDGLAPEGEFGMITDYDSSTYTATLDTLTAAIGAGDKVGIATPLFPLQDMIRLTNIALRNLGDIDLVDTSITTVSGQSEYTMPIMRQPKRVRIQTQNTSGDNQWEVLNNWKVIPKTPGTAWTLVLPDVDSGYSIELLYEAPHPEVTAYDSYIIETIHPDLALKSLLVEAYQWYNNSISGSNQYLLQRENKALQDLEQSRILHPIYRLPVQVGGMPHWGNKGDNVPLTSDRMV